MSLISCDISVVVIIRKCHRCRAGPHIYLSDITLGHHSNIAHLTRWTFSDTCLFCGFSCNSCKLTLSLEDIFSMLSYSLQYFPCHDYHRKYKHNLQPWCVHILDVFWVYHTQYLCWLSVKKASFLTSIHHAMCLYTSGKSCKCICITQHMLLRTWLRTEHNKGKQGRNLSSGISFGKWQ